MHLIFATNNANKVIELQAVVPQHIKIVTLKDAGIDIDIPEPHPTLLENAREKATTIYNLTQTACFSEDTGLEVTALNGEPGVKSARYAGEDKAFEKNIEKLLTNLQDSTDRSAQFRTVICLRYNTTEHFFEGICKGKITTEASGTGGFGYDAVFIPEGSTKTFAQMTIAKKNAYSHRRKAVDKLVEFLNNLNVKL